MLNRKPFQAPLATESASARTATARTWRGAATVASASGASTYAVARTIEESVADVDADEHHLERDRQDDRAGGRDPAATGAHLRAGAASVAARRRHGRTVPRPGPADNAPGAPG